MSVINVIIRNNTHQIACDEADFEHVKTLATNLGERIDKLNKTFVRASDIQLLLMTAITIEEELNELKKKQQQLTLNDNNAEKLSADKKNNNDVDIAVAQALDAISEYVESLAIKLKR
ncbi:Cell division protein ZapA [Rickettsiales bacterium Ac37b]|nr:Cell division protein ZapA [Rickettsiales bacterium Ac37b]